MVNRDVVRYPANDIERAAKQFPTPFFLYEEERIRYNCQRLKKVFEPLFPGFSPLYAVKANANPHVLKIIQSEGFGFDCSSPSEVFFLRQLGNHGMHTGNYLSEVEIREVLDTPHLLLNLDDISMLETVRKMGVPEFLSFRINPGITSGSMKSLLFAGPDAKYGVPWERAAEAYRAAKEMGLRRFGIHMMTGSNVRDETYFGLVTRKLLEVAGTVHRELGIEFETLNVGGGFGVPYRPDEASLDLGVVARNIRAAFDEVLPQFGMHEPRLMIEPGRLVMADAGFLVTRVNVIKDGYTRFAGVDAGMNDLPRPAIYDAYHHVSVLGKSVDEPLETVNVVGRLCENNDQFAKSRELPHLEPGDSVVIHNAGAHSYAMGHNYNGRTRSDEYLLRTTGELVHIRRAETVQDLMQTILPFALE